MAATKFGVIASTQNAIIRRYIYPDSDAELNSVLLGPGETLIQMQRRPFSSTAAWQAAVNTAVQAALGKPPGNPLCAVIDGTGLVVNMIQADADLDAGLFPGMTLVNTTTGGIGWTWTASGGFVPPPPSGPPLHPPDPP